MIEKYYSHGKLLLTGEYLVLDGALALAIPTSFGQYFTIESIEEPKIIWKSLDEKGNIWFDYVFFIEEIATPKKIEVRNDNNTSNRLIQILNVAKKLNPKFLSNNQGFKITTKLDFRRDWGLGSSSTLINNIASWANVDAYKLLELTFGGSGYDIAVTQYDSPILYSYQNFNPIVKPVKLQWNFIDKLFFVHLNKKQDSRKEVDKYRSQKNILSAKISEINEITLKILHCKSFQDFEVLLLNHEEIISEIIKQKPIKELLFQDYKGSIKSLGAWGGDFILATGDTANQDYFRKKGFKTMLTFNEMVLQKNPSSKR